MTPEQAKLIVEEAVALRKQWGKHYGMADLPHEFLDAVVVEVGRLRAAVLTEGQEALARKVLGDEAYDNAPAQAHPFELIDLKIKEQHDEIVLLKRQLGAAKSRETGLRKRLADMAQAGIEPKTDELGELRGG